MEVDRKAKLDELHRHLVAVATISMELKKTSPLVKEEGGWLLPGAEFSKLGLKKSPVSDEELLDWLSQKEEAVKSVKEREEMMKIIDKAVEFGTKIAPLLLAL